MDGKNQKFDKTLKIAGFAVLVMGILFVGKWFLFPANPTSYAVSDDSQATAVSAVVKGDVQEVVIDLQSGAYAPIVVQKGIPVRFNIRAAKEDINSCNGTVVIPEYNVKVALKPGNNILEFKPEQSGTIPYSCWMGMITSSIRVVDDIGKADLTASPVPAGGGGMPCCQRQQ